MITDPHQIKSATENNGDLSRENPDIRFSYSVEEANEFVESFNDRYGIPKEYAELHAVDGMDAIERLIKDKGLSERDAKELRENFNDSDAGGCALEGTNIIAIFTNKPFVRRHLMQIIPHELAHVAYERLEREEHNRFINALLNWFRSTPDGNKFIEELHKETDSKDWATETMAYFVGFEVEKNNWEKFFLWRN